MILKTPHESTCQYKELYVNTQSSFTCNGQMLEITQMSINTQMHKLWFFQTMEHCSPIKNALFKNLLLLFLFLKECTIDEPNNTDKSQSNFANLKKSDRGNLPGDQGLRLCSGRKGTGMIPGGGTEMPHAAWRCQKIKTDKKWNIWHDSTYIKL